MKRLVTAFRHAVTGYSDKLNDNCSCVWHWCCHGLAAVFRSRRRAGGASNPLRALTSLDLRDTQIADVGPLARLTALNSLDTRGACEFALRAEPLNAVSFERKPSDLAANADALRPPTGAA
jgi:hypothetical protein